MALDFFSKIRAMADMSVLIERLKCLTNEDYTAALLALQRKRWNTACKALLDSVGVNTDGNYLFCFISFVKKVYVYCFVNKC